MPILPEIKPGNWYFVVTCPSCHRQDSIGPAPSPSQTLGVYAWPYEAPCDCGTKTLHQPEKIQRLQAVVSPKPGSNVVFRLP